MIHTVNTGDELYVYMNGILIFKRWIKQQRSITFYNDEGCTRHKLNGDKEYTKRKTGSAYKGAERT